MNKPNKAIFLDRDGVINKERSTYVKTVSELEIFSGVASAVKKLKDAGFLVIIVTNQSAVNRGLTNHDNVNDIHFNIQEYFRKNDTFIDGFYYCPHRPDENCSCRKPKPGLLLKAAEELKIDLQSSWMIGDSDSDIQAAKLAGCKSIKINAETSLTSAIQTILSSIGS
ncbi:MAG: D-glycero-beta-D-manno-heptose 1,7-bisphosphate 7-phosphatase [Nitrosopumilales archaeon]|nr:MAG: D-glycero-beta-D-manno-heptose 1,7-bisphosphate 7-phosphatase [Nitrosopumilales archaeon]